MPMNNWYIFQPIPSSFISWTKTRAKPSTKMITCIFFSSSMKGAKFYKGMNTDWLRKLSQKVWSLSWKQWSTLKKIKSMWFITCCKYLHKISPILSKMWLELMSISRALSKSLWGKTMHGIMFGKNFLTGA